MRDLPLKAAVRLTVARAQVSQRIDDAVRDERGEIGSYMILAAGVALAAGAAVAILTPWFSQKATEIVAN